MVTTCIKCGEDNKEGARYCSQCANDLSATAVLSDEEKSSPIIKPAEPIPLEDPLIGKTVGGCVIEAKIGEGGMGTVYRGMQTSLERPVAIKILSAQLARSKSYITRFLRESKIVASIKHPNIVAVHDRGFEGPVYYFVMEFIEGHTVGDIVDVNGPLTPGDALEVARQSAHALRAAAAKNIIHRDIKPDNIMIERSGLIKVTDFGLVKNTTETTGGITGASDIMGTPSYMSPEQCRGDSIDHRGDIYSLGMTLYALLLGKPAFQAESTHGLLMKQVDEEPKPIHEVAEHVPDCIWPVLERMLEKKPDDRFPDWDAVIEALEELQDDYPAYFQCTNILQRPPSSRFPEASDTTPVTLPPARPSFELLDADKTTPTAPPGDTVAEKSQPKNPYITIINLSIVIVLILLTIFVVTRRWRGPESINSRTPAPATTPEPKELSEVDKVSDEIRDDLENGRFNEAMNKIKTMRKSHGDKKNKKTKEKVESTEKMYREMEPLWRQFHGSTGDAHNPDNSTALVDAIRKLQERALKGGKPNIRVRYDRMVKPLQNRMQSRFKRESGKARKLAEQSKWTEAVRTWLNAKRFAVTREQRDLCNTAITLARQKKNLPPDKTGSQKPDSKLLTDAVNAYKKRDLKTANRHLKKLLKTSPSAEEVLELKKKLDHARMVRVAAFGTGTGGNKTTVPAFEIGAYEVTNSQFGEFIKAKGYQTRKYWSRRGWTWKSRSRITAPMYKDMPSFYRPDQPVIGVSWHEAEAYCNWLSQVTGKTYRLPTVDEWKRAAAPKGRRPTWKKGNRKPLANVYDAGKFAPQSVGSYPKDKSAVGCMDVIGNAAEWCNRGDKFFASGGSFLTRFANIKSGSPSPVMVTSRSKQIGFRCVKNLK